MDAIPGRIAAKGRRGKIFSPGRDYFAQDMPVWVKEAVLKTEGIIECDVEVTFEPQWGQDNISEAGKLELGLV